MELTRSQAVDMAKSQTECVSMHHRDHSVYVPSQWEMALQYNAIAHWLGAYTEWSLHQNLLITPADTCHLLGSVCPYVVILWFVGQQSQGQAPVPLTIFRSNSKFDQNLQCSSLKCTHPTTTKICTRHDSVTVVTCAKCRFNRLNML